MAHVKHHWKRREHYGKKDQRFEVLYEEDNGLTSFSHRVLVDVATGAQYLFVHNGYAGGLCPLLDRDGRPLLI